MATVELIDGRYFIGIWFVGNHTSRDWLCAVYKDPGDDVFQVRHRFRYYTDGPNPFNDDKKSGYSGTIDDSEAEIETKMTQIAEQIAMTFGDGTRASMKYLPLHTNDAQLIIRKLRKQNWAHTKTLSKEEAKKQGYLK